MILLLGLSSCIPTSTLTSAPTLTATSTLKPIPLFTSTVTPLVCVKPLTPENETDFPNIEKVIFSWTEISIAASYVLNITMPSEDIVIFESEESEIVRYIEAFTQGGEYKWNVTPLNKSGEEICRSDFFFFTKPESSLPQTSGKPSNNTGTCHPGIIAYWEQSSPYPGSYLGETCIDEYAYDDCGTLFATLQSCGGEQ